MNVRLYPKGSFSSIAVHRSAHTSCISQISPETWRSVSQYLQGIGASSISSAHDPKATPGINNHMLGGFRGLIAYSYPSENPPNSSSGPSVSELDPFKSATGRSEQLAQRSKIRRIILANSPMIAGCAIPFLYTSDILSCTSRS